MPKKKGKQVNAAQQEKLEQKKLKKELARIGEDDIETILTQFKKADAAKVAVSEVECARPSPRITATLCAHPTKVISGSCYLFASLRCCAPPARTIPLTARLGCAHPLRW